MLTTYDGADEVATVGNGALLLYTWRGLYCVVGLSASLNVLFYQMASNFSSLNMRQKSGLA